MDYGKPLVKSELRLSLNPPPCAQDNNPTTPTGAASDGSSSPSCASAVVALSFLGLNSVVAIYRSRHDPRSILFVTVCFLCVVFLFHLLRVFERLPPESPRRLPVKAAVWAVTTTLTVMFSGRVAPLMPAPVAAVVWSMAAVTILAGFYLFFVCPDAASTAADEKPACKVAEGP
ncbi:hypothetical protein BDA96_03G298000 [Sorghum bicolor]|uniref:Uncharacterized protein n=1 Tax=Sorghum bicolor TaxID=4558 RepID=A0A921UPA3_SORBI|nr:hypothetical protein BDA96_03G298000 [Sorghum bicolor]